MECVIVPTLYNAFHQDFIMKILLCTIMLGYCISKHRYTDIINRSHRTLQVHSIYTQGILKWHSPNLLEINAITIHIITDDGITHFLSWISCCFTKISPKINRIQSLHSWHHYSTGTLCRTQSFKFNKWTELCVPLQIEK